ncbi:hypothetical protein BDQ12DRAFT_680666 [Crucibulum laeve]|uniref:Zn(2)-C6 fungal-type domain-containing protein n=1 Tax=Crucibulum laeve TaxID=68775 RepID=A0A5C3M4R5_9AGAR|nr:hypothetical protein BDQ12DRAFT_680666 [Crucibulum laeve]
MSNPYNQNQAWTQNRLSTYNQSHLQLEHEFDFSAPAGAPSLPQQQQQYANNYLFSQQQAPSNTNPSSSSSLHGAFTPTQQSQSRQTSFGSLAQAPAAPVAAGAFVRGAYGSSSNGTQPMGQNPPMNGAYRNNNSTPFNYPIAPGPAFSGLSTSASSPGYMSSSPGPIQETFAQASTSGSQHYPSSSASTSQPQAKRPRPQGYSDEPRDDDPDADMSPDQREGAKAKPPGACGRCKNLKVKCEFKTDTDPCKRCLNGGHECMIPGRKKRRTPPKREHLLNEIREQAAQIERLMAQLEATNAASSARTPASNGNSDISPPLQSPVLSPTSTAESYFSSDMHSSNNNPSVDKEANKAVEDWIAKAKESLQEFGGFIGIGGAGMPKNYLLDDDLEEPGNSGDDEYVDVGEDLEGYGNDDDRYDVVVENTDGRESDTGTSGNLRHKTSASSLSTTGQQRKKNSNESSKPAILPVEASPFGLFGNLSLQQQHRPRSRQSSVEPEDKGPGIANVNFFKSTPAPDTLDRRLSTVQHQAPHILTRGVISPPEAEKLFQIYFDTMNLSVSLLDPVLYTAQRTFYRSPFLFTVICAIASRFYTERPDLYPQAMHYAQLAAGTALISGAKNVEMCQAYILLSLYPVPARKWEDQRSWLYLGLAIRAATDLNLHLPTTAKPLNENHAREMLNRTRVWLNCFNLDRSTGSQYGKPPIISSADYMANHSLEWWKSSPYNMKNFDIHIAAYNSELKVMGRFIGKIYSDPEHPTGLNKEVDFEALSTEADEEFKSLWTYWSGVLAETDMTDPQNCFRTGLLRLAYSYARLIALSYGFQHAFGKNDGTDENPFLIRCLTAASDIVHAVVDDVCRPEQLHYWRHGPEAQSVFVTFASAFLVKLLQPKFASYLSIETRVEIRTLVQKVIDLLGSPEIAIDERHGPKLYSRFLKNLLAAPMARLDPTSPGASSNASLPRQRARRQQSEQTSDPFEMPSTVYTHPSPTNSLSPAPTKAALSFDNFAPIGAVDPFAPQVVGSINSININSLDDPNIGNISMSEFFQPSLPFDDDIMRSMQSNTDPSGWQDINIPVGFNWMPAFTQNLGLDLRNPDSDMYDAGNFNHYMTGGSS